MLETHSPYEIAVFTAPTPFRAGPVDLSVLVSNASTGEPVPNARVSITMVPRERPRQILRRVATTAAATNKLLRAAHFELDNPGWWDVTVEIEQDSDGIQIQFPLEASEPAPKWLAVWPWLAWPVLVVLFYGSHQYLVWLKVESRRHGLQRRRYRTERIS